MDKTETRPWPAQLIKHFEKTNAGNKADELVVAEFRSKPHC